MRRLFLSLMAVTLLVSCASGSGKTNNPGMPRAELPQPNWVTADQPIYLRVDTDPEGEMSVSTTERGSANLTIAFSERTPKSTSVVVESKAAVPLKFDMFISPDRKVFKYTSSCPLMANEKDGFQSFEMWPHPIAALAVANVRKQSGSFTCQ